MRPPTCDRLLAGRAPLGEELPEAVRAVGLVVPGGEPLPGQRLLAVGAGEALAVPRVVAVRHAALRDHLKCNAIVPSGARGESGARGPGAREVRCQVCTGSPNQSIGEHKENSKMPRCSVVIGTSCTTCVPLSSLCFTHFFLP